MFYRSKTNNNNNNNLASMGKRDMADEDWMDHELRKIKFKIMKFIISNEVTPVKI